VDLPGHRDTPCATEWRIPYSNVTPREPDIALGATTLWLFVLRVSFEPPGFQACRAGKFHQFLRCLVTPAKAAGIAETVMKMTDVVALIDAANTVPAIRGPCKKRVADEISN
jgi:hypothetical protein